MPKSDRSFAMDMRPGTCPSCERFVGTAVTCPYCDADAPVPRWLIWLRRLTPVLAVLAVVFLYLSARASDVPAVRVGDIRPTMNFAQISVEGTVCRDAYVARDDGEDAYLSFLIDDGTGRVRVAAYRDVAMTLLADNTVPRRGDRVCVAGALQVSAGREPRLRLQAAGQLRFKGRSESSSGERES